MIFLHRINAARRADTLQLRQLDKIRQGLNLSAVILRGKCEQKAKHVIFEFYKEINWKQKFLLSGSNYWLQILKVRQRFLHIIIMKRERMDILREKWEEQRKLLISEYEQEYFKNKSKGAKRMLKKLRSIIFQLRDMCLKLYLNKCRTEHNVAFFEWRK